MGLVVAGFSASKPSQNAVRWAAVEAERRTTGLCIVHAYPLPQLGQPVQHDVDKLLRKEAADLLDRVVESTRRDHPHLEIIDRLVQQAPVNALRAESVGAALTVVGAKESSRLGGAILGSIASAVAAVNPAPVAVVHADHPLNGSGPVVIGIDESGGSATAIEFAFAEASLRKVGLLAVHASSRLVPGDTPYGSPAHPDAAEVESGNAAVFSKGLASLRERFPHVVVTASVRHGRAATVLLECGVPASLVVVGRRPRGEFEAMIMGSTSRSLTAHSACPVVIVGPGALLDHERQ